MEKVKLGEICDFHSGNAWKADDFSDSGVPIIRINNLNQNDGDFVYWNQDYDEKYLVQKDDILLSLSGTIKVYKWHGIEALLNQRIVKIKPKRNTNIDWVYYKISHSIEEIISKAKSATIKNVSVNDIKNLDVLFPDLETQNKIVAILDKAKSILEKREATIKKYDELLRATFLEMFGDPVKNEKKFPIKNLKEFYCSKNEGTKCGPFGSALKLDEYIDNGIPVWNMDNISKKTMEFIPHPKLFISENKYYELEKYAVRNNDIIISRAGTVGKMCIVDSQYNKSIISTNLIRLRLNNNKLLPIYFLHLINFTGNRLVRLKKGAEDSFGHMSTSILDSIRFPYPSLNLQKEYINKVQILNKIYNKNILIYNKNKLLFESLLQSAFKGELDFNTAVDLELLLENDYQFFKENSNLSTIKLLLERLNSDERNDNRFYEQQTYDKAKDFVFELIKEGKVKQIFDEKTKKVKLTAVRHNNVEPK